MLPVFGTPWADDEEQSALGQYQRIQQLQKTPHILCKTQLFLLVNLQNFC